MARILGVDYGARRIGLALSDPDGIVATVLRLAEVASEAQAVAAVVAACRETEAERIVIGLPLTLRGTNGPMAERTQAFARTVEAASGLPVVLWDERFSTAQAERALAAGAVASRRRKGLRDMLAAQVTLQSYLDAQAAVAGKAAEGAEQDCDGALPD